ncbi:MAG: FAD:protein FMN transferase, partial [Pseudomonadota bacterium]
MRCTARLLLPLLPALLLAACGEPTVEKQRFLAMGTHIEIQTFGTGSDKAEAAIAEAREDLEYLHEGLHPWEAGALARVNQML